MYDTELGVKFPCFGDYECPKCDRKWESRFAWRDYGQMCKKCHEPGLVKGLQPLYFYYCEACILESNGEKGKWTYKYCEEGRPCRTCGEIAKPCDRRSLFLLPTNLSYGGSEVSSSAGDPDQHHLMKLCEKCRLLGRVCGRRLEEEEEEEKRLRTMEEEEEKRLRTMEEEKRLRTMEGEAKKVIYRNTDLEAKEKNWRLGTIKLAKFIRDQLRLAMKRRSGRRSTSLT